MEREGSREWRGFRGWLGGLSIVLIIFAIVLIVLWPFVFIWALNTLFATAIPLSLETWLAGVVLLLTLWAIGARGPRHKKWST